MTDFDSLRWLVVLLLSLLWATMGSATAVREYHKLYGITEARLADIDG